jgi:hypothetical protein
MQGELAGDLYTITSSEGSSVACDYESQYVHHAIRNVSMSFVVETHYFLVDI